MILHMQGSDAQAMKAHRQAEDNAAYGESDESKCVDEEMPDNPLKPFRMRSDPAVVHYGYQHAGIADLL